MKRSNLSVRTIWVLLVMFVSAIATAQTTPLPFFDGFEDLDNDTNWVLNNGMAVQNLSEKWYIHTAEHYAGKRCLYFSSNNGTSAIYNTRQLVQVAYRYFRLPAGSYDLSFAWRANGDNTNDCLYACWYDCTATTLIAGTMMGQPSWVATKAVRIDNATSLSGHSEWCIANGTINSAGPSQLYALVFVWKNDGAGVNAPSACVDNVQIAKKVCRPDNISATAVGSSLVITWTGTAVGYEVSYRAYGDTTMYTVTNVTSNSVTIPNVPEGVYDIFVRGICGTGNCDTSVWVTKNNVLVYDAQAHCIDYVNLDGANTTCTIGDFNDPYRRTAKVDNGYTSSTSRHTIHWIPGETDPRTNGQLKTVPPGEVMSVRLGNWETGAQAESVSYMHHLDSGSRMILLLKYAVVLEDPSHSAAEQPRFTLDILDNNGRQLDPTCGHIDFAARAGSPGWNTVSGSYGTVITWKDWTTIGIDLSPYASAGANDIKIRFTTRDCSQSGHYGYAYFVLNCAEAKVTGISCGAIATSAVSAPYGFRYEWYKANDPAQTVVCTTQSLNVATGDTSLYYCRVISLENSQCYLTLEANLMPNYPVARYTARWSPVNCQNGVTINNTSAVFTARGETGKKTESYYWDFGDYGTSTEENPTIAVPNEGDTVHIKLITGISEDQCQDTLEMDFIVPEIKATYDTIHAQICRGQSYRFDGSRYNREGIYDSRNRSRGGCDSIVVLDLKVVDQLETELYDTICAGETFTFNSQQFSRTGDYKQTLQTSGGCDSVITEHLYVYDPVTFTYNKTDEFTGPLSGSIEFIGIQPGWHYTVNGIDSMAVDSLAAGVYEVIFYNEFGCPSDPVRIEIDRTCLNITPGVVPEICADDESFTFDFTLNAGDYNSYSIKFDANAKAQGFEDVDSIASHTGTVEITIPKGVRPDSYTVRLSFDDAVCNEYNLDIPFNVKYPSSIMEQKWNNVIALLNDRYNGGYTFSAYRWYCNGTLLEKETGSYIYIGEGNSFNIGDSYYVALQRTGENYFVYSCALVPTTHTDQKPVITPTVIGGIAQNLPPISGTGNAIWYSTSGQQIASYHVDEFTETLPAPTIQGIYLLLIQTTETREVYKVVVR